MPAKRNYELAVDRTPTTLLGRAISHEIRIEILDLLLKDKQDRDCLAKEDRP